MEFQVSDIIPATPEEIYDTWLDSEGHWAMTGGRAKASAEAGGEFEAWEGYITGKNLDLERGKRILQSWRTAEFQPTDEDSELEITLHEVEGGTRVTLNHRKLPPHGSQYEQGWIDHYFEPMKLHFGR